ncbi:hypothetical protein P606_13280 [Comamonas thiooxydans]|nr:hypothetical protein P606_13280 [Comamonas thiooxydans]
MVKLAVAAYIYQSVNSESMTETVESWYAKAISHLNPSRDDAFKMLISLPLNYKNLFLVRKDDQEKVFKFVAAMQEQHGVRVPRADTCPKLRADLVLRVVETHLIKVAEPYTGIGNSMSNVNNRLTDIICRFIGCELDGSQLETAFTSFYRKVAVVDVPGQFPQYAFDLGGSVIGGADASYQGFGLIERLTLEHECEMLKERLVRMIRSREQGFAHSSSLDLTDIENVKLLCSNECRSAAIKYAVDTAPDYI